jgi:hypothetical protein
MKTRSLAFVILFIPFLLSPFHSDTGASASQATPKNAPSIRGIDSVLPENRARLLARVKAYVQAEHNRDWPAQYDLKPPELKPGETKEAFVARFQRMEKDGDLFQVLNFEVTDITPLITRPDRSAGDWMVSGCAAYHKQYVIGGEHYSSSIHVRLNEKEWFVAGIGIDAAVDGPPTDCHFHKNRGILGGK